jgi:hypothetical protein
MYTGEPEKPRREPLSPQHIKSTNLPGVGLVAQTYEIIAMEYFHILRLERLFSIKGICFYFSKNELTAILTVTFM